MALCRAVAIFQDTFPKVAFKEVCKAVGVQPDSFSFRFPRRRRRWRTAVDAAGASDDDNLTTIFSRDP
jgi:hypothetical protein